MHLTLDPRGLLRRLVSAFALLALLPASLLAQNTAALGGRVSDAATGRSLQGAVVRVLGTSATAYTDADGRFRPAARPAGPQRIEVDYVGLDPVVR